MKTNFFFIAVLFTLISCQTDEHKSMTKKQGISETIIQPVQAVEFSKKSAGRLCDLYDSDENKSYRVFLEDRNGMIVFRRVNETENIAFPSLRTMNIDFYFMYKVKDQNLFNVSIVEKMVINDKGVRKTHSEIITGQETPSKDGYTLFRKRFLRDIKKFTEDDWEISYPEPFHISSCKEDSLEVQLIELSERRYSIHKIF